MADCRRASRAEMQGWPAVEGLLSAGLGTAEAVGTLGLRLRTILVEAVGNSGDLADFCAAHESVFLCYKLF